MLLNDRIVVSLLALLVLTACAASITRPPDLGGHSQYPITLQRHGLLVSYEVPENLALDKSSAGAADSIRDSTGLLLANLRVTNIGDNTYVLYRDRMSLYLSDTAAFTPVDRFATIDIGSKPISFSFRQRELADAFARWAFPERVILRPGDSMVGYLFFDVGTYEQIDSTPILTITPTRVNELESFSIAIPRPAPGDVIPTISGVSTITVD